ncbi:MDR family MFS transporter [Streptomyces bambusae]|uniref:MFS transporter n=1 Tax=Streptomyces bambusae TaxID=1550616 RepID=A0ABS6Z1P5_9ACTN|nr:MFS transporter [Streptomyces bambusae]MBW5481652.1 MFS transporter [Streptomyces bambusae]
MSAASPIRAVRESVSGLPSTFWWLWTSTLVNRLGAFVATFMALYLTLERGYSASFAGLVVALHGLGGVVSSLGAGVMTDRLGRRPTMLVAQVATAGSVALLGFMEHPVAIAAVALLVGMASNASRPAVQAMLADIVPPEDRVRAFALNYWAINLGFAVSSVAAGVIAEYSYLAGFLGEAALTLACAVVVYLKLPESRPEPDGVGRAGRGGGGGGAGAAAAGGSAEKAEKVGLGTVVRDGRFMGVVGLSFLISLIFTQGSVGLPVAMGSAGFSPGDYGLVIAVNGVLIVLLQLPVTRLVERRDPKQLLVVSSLLAGYGFAMTAFAGSIAAYALTVCVWTLAEIINSPTQMDLVVRLSPVHGRGSYQGMYTMSWAVAALIAPLMSGLVIDRLGAAWLWGATGVLGTTAAVGYWALMRKLSQGLGTGATAKTSATAGTAGTSATAGTTAVTAETTSAATAAAPEAAVGPGVAAASGTAPGQGPAA